MSLVFGVIGNSDAAVLDVSEQWGDPITEITLSEDDTFIAVNVDGSGVDMVVTQTGDPIRDGFPRTFMSGGVSSVQGSAESMGGAGRASIVDVGGTTTVWAERGFIFQFYQTGTGRLAEVANLTFTIGDIDESELVGNFLASLDGVSQVLSLGLSSLPSHVSLQNNGTTGAYLLSDATSIDNGTNGGDVQVIVSNVIDSFSFTFEKGVDRNLGTVFNTISFDVVAVPEPSSVFFSAVALGTALLRRRRN